MTKRRRLLWAGKLMMWAVPGAAVLGTSCLADARKNMVAAGLAFVKETAGNILDLVVPINDVIKGAGK